MSANLETSVIQLAAKGAILLASSWLCHVALSRWNPRWQVWMWRVATVGVATLLIAATLPPMYGMPLFTDPIAASNPNSNRESLKARLKPLQRPRGNQTEATQDSRSSPMDSSPLDTPNADDPQSIDDPSDPLISASLANHSNSSAMTPESPPVVESIATRINAMQRGLELYLLVVCWLLLRPAIGLWMASREVTAATAAPEWIQDIARQLHGDSPRLTPDVRITDRFNSPALCGLFRKTILLPHSMLDESSPERDLRGAIAHESAHASGNDLFWDLVIAAITAFAWPIPLAWRIRSAHRAACERVSDRMAVDCLGDLQAYQRLVARIALRVAGATSNVGLAMARTSEVRQRLTSLASCPRVPQLGVRAMVLAVLLTVIASGLGVGSLVVSAVDVVDRTDTALAKNDVQRDGASADDSANQNASVSADEDSTAEKSLGRVRSAGSESDARIRIVIPSPENVFDDLRWLIGLSPTDELKKQWQQLKHEILDAFTEGLNLGQPLEMDLVLRNDDLSYDFRLPVAKFAGPRSLMENIRGMGFRTKAIGDESLFEIFEKGKKPFYLRYTNHYAWMSPVKEVLSPRLPDATDDMDSLLDMRMDVALEMKNDAAGIDSRRQSFRGFRNQLEPWTKRRPDEKESDHQLRKITILHRLDQVERVIAEAEAVQIGWKTSHSDTTPFGRGRVSLTALPGTELEQSLEQFAAKPSAFANVVLHSYPLATGRFTWPLDPFCTKRLKEFLKAVRPTDDSDDAARRQVTNKIVDLMDATLQLGVVDGFIDAHSDESGKNTFVGGIRTANGKTADEIISLLPRMTAPWHVNLNIQQHGQVSIHEVTVPKSQLASFQLFFKDETVFHVGTSQEALWVAAGSDGLQQLKTAIDQASQPAPRKVTPVVASYQIHAGELMKLMKVVINESTRADSAEPKKPVPEILRYCALAERSMADSNPRIRGELRRTDNKLEGFVELNESVLKFVGTILADGIKQLLE